MKNKLFYKLSFFSSLLVFGVSAFSIHSVHAAEIDLITKSETISQDQVLTVDVMIDAQGQDVNAVQTEILFPSDHFKLQGINNGNSVISLWVNPPKETTPGVIDLAGVMPGGFTGSNAELFSFTLKPIAVGTFSLTFASSSVLANDGSGTALPVQVQNVSIAVTPTSGQSMPSAPVTNYTAPNSFVPEIATDTNTFSGQYFLVFNTSDNLSGIDHYEVLEVPSGASQKPFSSWHVARSPYVLTDQSLSSDIYVRAVDHNGNFIVVKLPAENPGLSGQKNDLLIILLFILVVLLLLWIRRHKMRTPQELF